MWCRAFVWLVLVARAAAGDGADDADDEGDSAAFTVAVEGGAVRCVGALLSLRTALTTARCAAGSELWVRAPYSHRPHAAAQVLRVAVAADAQLDEAEEAEWQWSGAGADLALLEMAVPLAGARPIVAAAAADCGAAQACYLLRHTRRGSRIVSAQLSEASTCSARGALWPLDARDLTLCLVGPELCQSEWGAGVVCDGKLCGVLSRSARGVTRGAHTEPADPEEGEEAEPPAGALRCGDTHAAVNLPRRRRFLHCAHLHGACGRDGECARLCSERWLLAPSAPAARPAAPGPADEGSDYEDGPASSTDRRAANTTTTESTVSVVAASSPTRPTRTTSPAQPSVSPSPIALVAADAARAQPARGALEFEPNRADFKAGEYGDNAADYGVDEMAAGGAAGRRSTAPASHAPAPAPDPRVAPPAAPLAAPSAAPRAAAVAPVSAAPAGTPPTERRDPPPAALSLASPCTLPPVAGFVLLLTIYIKLCT